MRIWYGDGSIYYDWDTAPDFGVQLIIVDEAPGYKTIIMGQDIYHDPTGKSTKVKAGAWMPEQDYMILVDKAMAS